MGGRWSLVRIQSPRPFSRRPSRHVPSPPRRHRAASGPGRSFGGRSAMIAILGYLAADACVRILPARLADGISVRLARLAFALGVPARGALERNLTRLLGNAPLR